MKKIISMICIVLVLASMTSSVYAAKKDTKAPVITKTNPVDYATDIMIENTIIIRFNETIKKGKNIAKISIKENETKSIEFSYVIKDNLLELTPKTDLKYDTVYVVSIPAAAIKDTAGNNLKSNYAFNFITELDPSKATNVGTVIGTKYVIEIEANLQEALTPVKISYFEQMLSKFGIDATFKDVRLEEQESATNTNGN